MSYAVYNPETNQVKTFIREDHGGYIPNPPYILVFDNELSEGWTLENVEPPTWTNLEFYNKFTPEEKVAFEMASVATDQQGALVAVLLTTFLVNPVIWAADPNFIYGMNALVSVGVISQERLTEIMDGYTFPS
jgi:hypothetical protein